MSVECDLFFTYEGDKVPSTETWPTGPPSTTISNFNWYYGNNSKAQWTLGDKSWDSSITSYKPSDDGNACIISLSYDGDKAQLATKTYINRIGLIFITRINPTDAIPGKVVGYQYWTVNDPQDNISFDYKPLDPLSTHLRIDHSVVNSGINWWFVNGLGQSAGGDLRSDILCTNTNPSPPTGITGAFQQLIFTNPSVALPHLGVKDKDQSTFQLNATTPWQTCTTPSSIHLLSFVVDNPIGSAADPSNVCYDPHGPAPPEPPASPPKGPPPAGPPAVPVPVPTPRPKPRPTIPTTPPSTLPPPLGPTHALSIAVVVFIISFVFFGSRVKKIIEKSKGGKVSVKHTLLRWR